MTAAGELFARRGYAATSIDDLVQTLGLHRGSLYKAFASKQGLFRKALARCVDTALPATIAGADTRRLLNSGVLDLLLVAALELAADDAEVRALLDNAWAQLAASTCAVDGPVAGVPAPVLSLIGGRLIQRAQP